MKFHKLVNKILRLVDARLVRASTYLGVTDVKQEKPADPHADHDDHDGGDGEVEQHGRFSYRSTAKPSNSCGRDVEGADPWQSGIGMAGFPFARIKPG